MEPRDHQRDCLATISRQRNDISGTKELLNPVSVMSGEMSYTSIFSPVNIVTHKGIKIIKIQTRLTLPAAEDEVFFIELLAICINIKQAGVLHIIKVENVLAI